MRLQAKNLRQEVTGLTVNEKPNVRRKYVRQIRAMLHAWRRYGLAAAEQEFRTVYDKRHRGPFKEPALFKQVVKGKIEFLGMVKGKCDPIYLRFLAQLRELAPDLVRHPVYPYEVLYERLIELERAQDPQRRGFELQGLLRQVFDLYGISVDEPFTRNSGAEQIDGAFVFESRYYRESVIGKINSASEFAITILGQNNASPRCRISMWQIQKWIFRWS